MNQAEAYFTHTAMVAKKNAPAIIHSACNFRGQFECSRGTGFAGASEVAMFILYHSWKCCMPSSMGLW